MPVLASLILSKLGSGDTSACGLSHVLVSHLRASYSFGGMQIGHCLLCGCELREIRSADLPGIDY